MDNNNPREFGWVESSDSDRDIDIDEAEDRHHANQPKSPSRLRIAWGPVIRINPRMTHNYRRFWRNCLIGTLVDCRHFTVRRLQGIVDNCWNLQGAVRVVGVSRNNYVLHFNNLHDRIFILEEGPWSVLGGLLFFAPWEPNLVLTDYHIAEIPVWIQLWGIPLEFQTPAVGSALGSILGVCLEVDWSLEFPRNLRFIRIHVRIPIDSPPLMGFMINIDVNQTIWVQCRYERTYRICTGCGRIGHTYPACDWQEQRINASLHTQMNRINRLFGLQIGFVVSRLHFVNQARGFLNHSNRRTTHVDIELRGDDYVYRPIQNPPLHFDFDPFEFFNEDGDFGNHNGEMVYDFPPHNGPMAKHLFPVEIPTIDPEEEDPMEWDADDEEEGDDVGFVPGFIPENPLEPPLAPHAVNFAPINALEIEDNRDSSPDDNVQFEPLPEEPGEPVEDNTQHVDSRIVISDEEMQTMVEDPDLRSTALRYYRTPPDFVFPLPLFHVNDVESAPPEVINAEQILCFFDMGIGELCVSNGQLCMDTDSYPVFDENGCMDAADSARFWANSRIISEDGSFECFTIPNVVTPPQSSYAGPSGTAASRQEDDFMVVGTITEMLQPTVNADDLAIVPYTPTVINMENDTQGFSEVILEDCHDTYVQKLDHLICEARKTATIIKAAKYLFDALLSAVKSDTGPTCDQRFAEVSRKRSFDRIAPEDAVTGWTKKLKKRKNTVTLHLIGGNEDVPPNESNKKLKSATIEALTHEEPNFEDMMEMLVNQLLRIHLGFRKVVPKQPPSDQ